MKRYNFFHYANKWFHFFFYRDNAFWASCVQLNMNGKKESNKNDLKRIQSGITGPNQQWEQKSNQKSVREWEGRKEERKNAKKYIKDCQHKQKIKSRTKSSMRYITYRCVYDHFGSIVFNVSYPYISPSSKWLPILWYTRKNKKTVKFPNHVLTHYNSLHGWLCEQQVANKKSLRQTSAF